MVIETTKTNLSPRETFEAKLQEVFFQSSDTQLGNIASSLHFNHAVPAADEALGSGKWYERLFNKTNEQSGEVKFTKDNGQAGTIEWQKISRGNDTLLMATDGTNAYITTDDSQSAKDWIENVNGASYRLGRFRDKIGEKVNNFLGGALDSFGFEREGAEENPIHAAYRHTLVNGGSKSLEARSMNQLSEWLEEYPDLQVNITGFSRGARAEFLADNVIAITQQHNEEHGTSANLAHVTTLNAPEIGKRNWRDEMDEIYAAAGTEVTHIEGARDPVSNLDKGQKTGIERTFVDNFLTSEPSREARSTLASIDSHFSDNNLIARHTQTDDMILGNLNNITILTPEQSATFNTKIEALKPSSPDFHTDYAALKSDLLNPPTNLAHINIENIQLNTSITHQKDEVNPTLNEEFSAPHATAMAALTSNARSV